MSTRNEKGGKKVHPAAYIFLGFLALLGLFNVFIHAPLGRTVNIGREGLGNAAPGGGRWYQLEAEDYQVAGVLGEIDVSNSTFRFLSTRYTYYCAIIHGPNGRTMALPVCVKGQKAQSLAAGTPVPLYGTLSKQRASVETELERFGTEAEEISALCLNDNGTTVFLRWCSAAAFAALAAAAVFLMVKIARR